MNIIIGSFQSNLSIQLCLFSEYFLCCNNQKLVLTSCFSVVQSAQDLKSYNSVFLQPSLHNITLYRNRVTVDMVCDLLKVTSQL